MPLFRNLYHSYSDDFDCDRDRDYNSWSCKSLLMSFDFLPLNIVRQTLKKNHYSLGKCFFSKKRHFENLIQIDSLTPEIYGEILRKLIFSYKHMNAFFSYEPPDNRQNFKRRTSESNFPLPTRFLQPLLIMIICSKIAFSWL